MIIDGGMAKTVTRVETDLFHPHHPYHHWRGRSSRNIQRVTIVQYTFMIGIVL